ncbi:membrane protein [Streptomyces phage RosePharie]|nr:membrane protein [Streptomyces phage RosePharie]
MKGELKQDLRAFFEGFVSGCGGCLVWAFIGFLLSLPFWYHN